MAVIRRLKGQARAILGRPFGVSPQRGLQSGMSLIEIIIVVALIGTLMTYMIRNLMGASEEARKDQARLAMGNIRSSLDMYRIHNNRYPTTDQGLSALMTDPGNAKNWRGPYIEENQLRDPWGEDFSFESDGKEFKIISAGPDNEVGTGDDVVYPEPSGDNTSEN